MPLDGTNYDTPALRAPLLAEMPVVFKPRRNQHRLDYRPVAWSLGTDRELPWTVVTDHYNTGDLSRATAMERIFLGRGWGRLVWQAWNSVAVPTMSPELDQRCPDFGWSAPPKNGWVLNNCRIVTTIIGADGNLTGAQEWRP